MNKRQAKKWRKNHITLINRETGKRQTMKLKDFIMLAKIAGLTWEDIEFMCERGSKNDD